MRVHSNNPYVQQKGCCLLGVLQAGGDCLNDGIRQLMLQARVPDLLANALRTVALNSDESLWSAVFCLGILLQDGEHTTSCIAPALLSAGILPALRTALNARRDAPRSHLAADDLTVSVGALVLQVLEQASTTRRRFLQRVRHAFAPAWCLLAAAVTMNLQRN